MPADIDLRDEVLKRIDQEIAEVSDCRSCYSAETARTALCHLREIAEAHKMERDTWREVEETFCVFCNCDWPCPTLLSLARDYAPNALAMMEVKK